MACSSFRLEDTTRAVPRLPSNKDVQRKLGAGQRHAIPACVLSTTMYAHTAPTNIVDLDSGSPHGAAPWDGPTLTHGQIVRADYLLYTLAAGFAPSPPRAGVWAVWDLRSSYCQFLGMVMAAAVAYPIPTKSLLLGSGNLCSSLARKDVMDVAPHWAISSTARPDPTVRCLPVFPRCPSSGCWGSI